MKKENLKKRGESAEQLSFKKWCDRKKKKAERGKGIKMLNKSNTDEPIKVLRAVMKSGFKKIHREALAHRGAEEC